MKKNRKKAILRIAIMMMVSIIAISMSACGGFKIEGSWKQVGDNTWGQAQPGAIVNFTSNGQANLFSPVDSYAFYKEGSDYRLDVTGLLGGTSSFTVRVINNNEIELLQGSEVMVALKRV